MKKRLILKESELIRLIKNIIKESNVVGLKIDDFKSVDSFILNESIDSIDYTSKSKTKDNNPEFILKFYKKPNNGLYKVQSIAHYYLNNEIGYQYVDFFDDNNETNTLITDSEIIDNGKDYLIGYLVDSNNIYNYIKGCIKFLENNKL